MEKEIRPNIAVYRTAQLISGIMSRVVFGCRLRRNEIKDRTGAFVVIGNHQCESDFVNMVELFYELSHAEAR